MTNIDWNKPASLYTVVCRPALPKDTADVFELTRTIWEGHDYVPFVWNDWLADTEGLLAVAEYGGHTVGLGKLTRLTEKEWWLEGLRVNPEFQGRGIGSRLMLYLYDHWEKNFGNTVRLATACYNLTVQHLNERFGFNKLEEFSEFSVSSIPVNTSIEDIGFTPIQVDRASEAAKFAQYSETIQFSKGMMDSGYQWSTPAPVLIVEAIDRGQAWWWRKDQGVVLLMKWHDDADRLILKICMLACQWNDLSAIVQDVRRLTAISGYERLQWVASLSPNLQKFLYENEFTRDWKDSVYLYEKTLPS